MKISLGLLTFGICMQMNVLLAKFISQKICDTANPRKQERRKIRISNVKGFVDLQTDFVEKDTQR